MEVELDWVKPTEALPFDDSEFDVVTSSFGAIVAPNHNAVAPTSAGVGVAAIGVWIARSRLGALDPPKPRRHSSRVVDIDALEGSIL